MKKYNSALKRINLCSDKINRRKQLNAFSMGLKRQQNLILKTLKKINNMR